MTWKKATTHNNTWIETIETNTPAKGGIEWHLTNTQNHPIVWWHPGYGTPVTSRHLPQNWILT